MPGAARTTIVREGTIWSGGAAPEVYPQHDLVIEDGNVVAIEANYKGRCDHEVDAGGCLVVPGLINAHVHAGCTPHIRGISEDLPIPAEGAYYHLLGGLLTLGYSMLERDEFAAIMEWDAIAMLLGGATTIVEENFGGHETWIELVGKLGFRSDLGLTYPNQVSAIGFMKDGKIVMGDVGDISAQFAAGVDLYKTHNGHFDDRLRVHLSPHGPDTVPEEMLRETRRLSDEIGVNANLHLAQHLNERRTIEDRHGKSSVEYLNDIEFLGPRVMAMHVTFVDDHDIDLLAATGTNVVHGSYRKAKEALTSPFWEHLENGVNVAIATDSFCHDLIQDLRFAAMLGKIRQEDSGHPRADHVLKCATYGAARALGRTDLGHLQPGAKGDVVVVDISTPFNAPVYDPLRSLVYYSGARDIRCTLVDGAPVAENGRVLGTDMDEVFKRATAASERLWEAGRREGFLS